MTTVVRTPPTSTTLVRSSPDTTYIVSIGGTRGPRGPRGIGVGSFYLDDLVDVDADSPTTNYVLGWDGAVWLPVAQTGGGAGITDGTYGDVVVTGSGTIWTVPDLATLSTAIGAEATARAGGDATNATAISNETTARVADVDAEEAARIAADAAHVAAADPHTQYQKESERNAANGYAPLDAGGLLPTANLPPLAITNVYTVADQTAMLALTAESGDVAYRTDTSEFYILTASPASTLGNWKLLTAPNAVVSVDGRVGVVTLSDLYDALGAASSAVAAHVALPDPHTQYLTAAEGNAAYDPAGTSSAGIAAHVAAADPHTGYQKESEKDAANGYAGLDGSGLVPDARIAASIARDSEVTTAVGTETTNRIADVDAEETARIAADAAHVTATGAHAANKIAFTPDGSISASDVQAAIVEVRDEAGGATLATDGWHPNIARNAKFEEYPLAGRSVTGGVTTNTSTTISTAGVLGYAAKFSELDIGATISGTNIPAGARITAVNPGANEATISAAATGSGSGITFTVGTGPPVGWTNTNATLSKNTTNPPPGQTYGLRLQASSAAASSISQVLLNAESVLYARSKWIAVSVIIRVPTGQVGAGIATLRLADGVNTVDALNAGSFDTYEARTLTMLVDAAATSLTLTIFGDTASNASADITLGAVTVVVDGQEQRDISIISSLELAGKAVVHGDLTVTREFLTGLGRVDVGNPTSIFGLFFSWAANHRIWRNDYPFPSVELNPSGTFMGVGTTPPAMPSPSLVGSAAGFGQIGYTATLDYDSTTLTNAPTAATHAARKDTVDAGDLIGLTLASVFA